MILYVLLSEHGTFCLTLWRALAQGTDDQLLDEALLHHIFI